MKELENIHRENPIKTIAKIFIRLNKVKFPESFHNEFMNTSEPFQKPKSTFLLDDQMKIHRIYYTIFTYSWIMLRMFMRFKSRHLYRFIKGLCLLSHGCYVHPVAKDHVANGIYFHC